MNENIKMTAESPKATRIYRIPECILAWLSYLCAFLFCRVFPVGDHPLGGSLLIFFLYVATTVLLYLLGHRPKPFAFLVGASAIILSGALVISANGFLNFFAYGYAILTYFYFVYASVGKRGFSGALPLDYARALTVLPLRSAGAMFSAMLMGRGKGSGKQLLRILAGIAIAVIPTSIVVALLTYDDNFTKILGDIFRIDSGDLFLNVFRLALAIPLGMLTFSVYVSATDGVGEDACTEEKMATARAQLRILPTLTVLTAVVPLLFLYVVFFISQWQYYISGFTGRLPADFSYAEYAREGFFQLCAVSVINFLIIVAVALLMKRKDERPPLALKILTVVFSVFTLVLISTAVSKMILYINRFGLTQKRVYATWFMILLAIVFVLVAVGMFVRRFKTVLVCVLVCLALFAGLALCGPDRLIAEYNVDRYLDGSLETVDVGAMGDLGYSAIPAMVRLFEEMPDDWELRAKVVNYLNFYAHNVPELSPEKESSVFDFELPAYRAKKALARYIAIRDGGEE